MEVDSVDSSERMSLFFVEGAWGRFAVDATPLAHRKGNRVPWILWRCLGGIWSTSQVLDGGLLGDSTWDPGEAKRKWKISLMRMHRRMHLRLWQKHWFPPSFSIERGSEIMQTRNLFSPGLDISLIFHILLEPAKGPNPLRLRKHSRVLQPILERHTREGGKPGWKLRWSPESVMTSAMK